jgi:hypothetical protein
MPTLAKIKEKGWGGVGGREEAVEEAVKIDGRGGRVTRSGWLELISQHFTIP